MTHNAPHKGARDRLDLREPAQVVPAPATRVPARQLSTGNSDQEASGWSRRLHCGRESARRLVRTGPPELAAQGFETACVERIVAQARPDVSQPCEQQHRGRRRQCGVDGN